MREELDALIGVGWGESSPKRKGYRNGYNSRDLVTTTGRVEDLQVPRDRAGQFHTQVFERYRSSEPQVAQGLTETFVAGVSTHKVGEVAQTLMGVAPSASTISRLNQTLTQLRPSMPLRVSGASCAGARIRLTCSPPRPVALPSSGLPSRIFACTNSRWNEA
jgi:hypothetical protein